ncbi:MAG: glycosyltransferase [Coriobacteriia bacterium]|nr:glycosyltransferase [Coriobacteriia bacterium]
MYEAGKKISIIISAQAEGIFVHKTILSVNEAMRSLASEVDFELILLVDNPDDKTREYLACNKEGLLQNVQIVVNEPSDQGLYCQAAFDLAEGCYAILLKAGDLLGSSFLSTVVKSLFLPGQAHKSRIFHPEYLVHFGCEEWLEVLDTSSLPEQSALLAVYDNYWGSIMVAPRELLVSNPRPRAAEGLGHLEWWLNATAIAQGIEQVVVPRSVCFVRETSLSNARTSSWRPPQVLPNNKLFSGALLRGERKEEVDYYGILENSRVSKLRKLKDFVYGSFPSLYLKLYHDIKVPQKLMQKQRALGLPEWAVNQLDSGIELKKLGKKDTPQWLLDEWMHMHWLDAAVIPPDKMPRPIALRNKKDETQLAIKVGEQFKNMLSQLRHNSYDYVMILPWVMVGGGDKYSLEMLNMLKKLRPDRRYLLVATHYAQNGYINRLDEDIDFVDIGNIAISSSYRVQLLLLEHLVETVKPSYVQVINSELAYDYLVRNKQYLASQDISVIITSFNMRIDKGFASSFTVSHAPQVLEQATLATSDNFETLRIWQEDYGINEDRLMCIRQGVEFAQNEGSAIKKAGSRLRVLWASRLDAQKIPEIIPDIAKQVSSFADIDIYGYFADKKYKKVMKHLPGNARYKGEFSGGLAALNKESYDVYLYTSSSDGTPNAILESFGIGLPVVAPAVGGISDVVISTKTGVLVKDYLDASEYAEALQTMRDDVLRHELAQAAQQFLREELSPETFMVNMQSFAQRIGL